MGAYDQAIAAAQRALALATASGEVGLYAQANYYLAQLPGSGDYRQAIDCFRQTVASLEGTPPHERFGLPNLPTVLSRAWLAVCYAELGMFAEGRALGKKGCGLPRWLRTPGVLCAPITGLVCWPYTRAICPGPSPARTGHGHMSRRGPPGLAPLDGHGLGCGVHLSGRVADAVPLLTQAMEQATATAMIDMQGRYSPE